MRQNGFMNKIIIPFPARFCLPDFGEAPLYRRPVFGYYMFDNYMQDVYREFIR